MFFSATTVHVSRPTWRARWRGSASVEPRPWEVGPTPLRLVEPRPRNTTPVPTVTVRSAAELDGKSWIECKTTQATRSKPSKPILVDNTILGQEFCKRFLRKLNSLRRCGQLELDGNLAELLDEATWKAFTPSDNTEATDSQTPSCPKCQQPTQQTSDTRRIAWRDLFYGSDHPAWFES